MQLAARLSACAFAVLLSSLPSFAQTCVPPVERPVALTWRMLTTATAQITWVPPSPAPFTNYRVEVGSATGLSDVAIVTSGSRARTFVTVSLPGAGTFFARVRGAGGCNGLDGPASVEIQIQAGAASPPSATVVVNEFNSFLELKNLSSAPVAIGGWRIQTTTGTDQTGLLAATIRDGVIMPQGCTYLLATADAPILIPADEPLNISIGDGVAVVRPDGFIIDSAGRANSFSAAAVDTPFIEGTPLRARRDTPSVASFARVGDLDTNTNGVDFVEQSTGTPRSLSGCFIQPPDQPTMLGAGAVGSAINLSWQPPSAGSPRDGFIVQIGTAFGLTNVLNQRIGNVTTFQTGPLLAGVYSVRVRAYNGAGVSNPSNDVTVSVGITPRLPGPPRNLAAVVSGSTVVVTWDAPTTGDPPLLYKLIAGTMPGASNAADFPLSEILRQITVPNVPDGVYYARMHALNAAGISLASNEATIVVCTRAPCLSPPWAVTNLVFQVSGNNVLLAWNAPAGGGVPTTYIIEAGTAPGLSNLGQFATGSVASFVIVAGVPPGTYFVRVRAAVGGVVGPVSNEVVIAVP